MKIRTNSLLGALAVFALSVVSVNAALTAYEGFYTTANTSPSGFSDVLSVGLSGTWTALQNQGTIQSRTTDTHWDAAAANLSAYSIAYPIKNGGYYNFVENNGSIGQFQVGLGSPVNLTSGTYYMSFTVSSGSSDCYAEVGLANSTSGNELMWGEGWNPGVGIHYSPSAGFNPNSYRATQTGPGLSNWDVWLYVAQLSQSGGTVTMNLYCYDLNTVTSLPLDVSAATPFWTTTLSGVSDTTFDKLAFEVAGYNGNYPSVGQIRLGTTWASVLGVTVSATNQVWNGAGTNNNWSTGSNWVSTVSPALGDYVTFAGATQTTVNLDTNAYVGSLTFSNNAGSFNITNSGNTLTLGGGLTNNSANPQTLDVPVALGGSQTINAASGNVTISRAVSGGGLTILGSGETVTLSGANTYTGNTAIQSGSTLVLSNPAAATYTGAFTGSGTLVKRGANTLILTGANNFTGTTIVSNGTLFVKGPSGQSLGSSLTVADGTTLGVKATADATYLSPSSLTLGSSSGATLQFFVRGMNNAILNPGTLTLNGTTTINISSSPYATNVNFPLLTHYTAGTLVLGSQPLGWHGKLTVTGSTVSYTVTNFDFVHPGCLSKDSDFARMRAKVQAGIEPWASGFNKLANTHLVHDELWYYGTAWSHLVRGNGGVDPSDPCYFIDSQWAQWDAAQAYEMSVYYQVTGDTRYADTAVGVLNNWARTCVEICGDPNSELVTMQGYQFACAGENLRNYPGWDPEDFAKFQAWMTNVWYPGNCHAYLTAHMGTSPTFIYANWDLGAMACMAAIGVVADRRDIYNEAISYYTNYMAPSGNSGSGCGQAYNLLVYLHPGYMGEMQESGRDQGHATLDPILLSVLCEIAWNQGDDMYGFNSNACLAISEYECKYNQWHDVPFKTYYCGGQWPGNADQVFLGMGDGGRGMYRAGYEMIWNHYENRRGLSAPYTKATALGGRPEGGGYDFGVSASGAYDQVGFTTLTHVLDPVTNPPAPSGLYAEVNNRAVTLSWLGSANANSYNVKRSTNNGASYQTIASGMGMEHFYTDAGLLPGTNYLYAVSAVVNGVETTNSTPLLVTANQLLSGTWIGSPGSWSWGMTGDRAFDGSMRSYYDAANASGDWTGLDLGVSNVITGVAYCPRPGNASRMVGGQFQGANVANFNSGVVTLFTVSSTPTDAMPPVMTYQAINNANAFRYVRYIGPTGAACDVSEIQFYGYASPASKPLAPTGVTASGGMSQVTLNWTPAAGADSYNVWRSLTNGGTYAQVATGVTAASYVDGGLNNGTTYYYVVTAVNAAGEGPQSGQVSATPSYSPTADVVWSGELTGTWDTTTLNWQKNLGMLTYHDGNSVLFDDTASVNSTVNLVTSFSPSSVTFNNGWRGYTITGGSIIGSAALTKMNGGLVTLNTANSYTGGTTLGGGTLTLGNAGALSTGIVTMSGGTLNNNGGYNFTNSIVLAGGNSAIQLGSANNLTVSGPISGNGSLTLGNDGNTSSLYLSGANTMTGGNITVANNGNYVRFSSTVTCNGNADWTFNNTTAGRTTLEFGTGTFNLGSLSGGGIIQGNYGGAMNVTMLVGGNNNSTTFSGIIHNNPAGSGTIGLTKIGSGKLWLTSACDYSGPTTVTNGQLIISSAFASKTSCWVTNGAAFGVTNSAASSGAILNLTLAAGTTLELLNVTSGTTALLQASNIVVGGVTTVKITQPNGVIATGTFPLVNYAGNFQGSFANLQLQPPAGVTGTLVSNANQITLNVTALPAPAAPSTLTAVAGNAQVTLNWSAPPYAVGYNVWRSLVSGGGYALANSTAGTSFTDTGLINGQTYYYVVTATNAFGSSGNSPEASATPQIMGVSVNFQGGSVGNGTPSVMGSTENAGVFVSSNWNNAAGASGAVSPLTQSDGNTTPLSVTWSGNNTWSTPVAESAGNYRMMKGYLDTSDTSTSTVSVSGVPSAYTNNGYSVYVYFDGDNGGTAKSAAYTIGSRTINGTDSGNFSGTFTRANNSAGNYVLFTNQTATGFTLSAVPLDASGGRAPVNGIQIVSQTAAISQAAAPTGLNATAGNAQVALSWNVSSGATSYRVKRATVNGGPYTTITNVASASFINTGLLNGTTYYYVVTALNTGGESANSVQASATPVSNTPVPMGFVATNGVLKINWPADHVGWRLQSQTNALNAGIGTNWVDVPAAVSTNQITIPLDASNGSVFYRLIYP